MAQNNPVVTLAQLTSGPAFDSRTSTVWLQISFGQGYYTVGGVPSGIAAFVESLTIDANAYLGGSIRSEATTTFDGSSLPVAGGVEYKYVPSTDKIQMFVNGVEFTASEAIPHAVLFDTIVAQLTYNRL